MTTKTRYIEAVGRRKTATCRVRIEESTKEAFTVNGVALHEYFDTPSLQATARQAIDALGLEQKFTVSAKVLGGGISGQAEAVRHGLSRAVVEWDEELKKKLKQAGFLKRDPRAKERKKFGLKKARKAPTWSKR